MKYGTPLKFGILGGLLMIAGYIVYYLIDVTLLASFFTLLLYAFPLFCMIYGGITYRKENNGYKSFGEAFLVVFIISIVSAWIIDWFVFALYTFFDPSLVEVMKQATIEKTTAIYEKMNLPEDEIERKLKTLKYTDFTPNLTTQAIKMASSLIVSLLLSALIAVFVKRSDNTGNFNA
jgi:hypothetical protein